MDKTKLVIAVLCMIVIGVVGFAYFQAISGGDRTTWAAPENATLVEHGKGLYASYCAECHGQNLEGQPDWRVRNEDGTLPAPPHDETGHTWHHPDPLLFEITKDGGQKGAPEGFVSGMPEFGSTLSDEDIWAVLAYIKSSWPEVIQKRHAQMSKRMKP